MVSFRWLDAPDPTFTDGYVRYVNRVRDTLYAIMVEEAPNVQMFMRLTAPWHDDCMPGREYLKAEPFFDSRTGRVGIMAYYDIDLYVRNCPEAKFDFGIAHETYTFPHAGVISIILPRRPGTVLGDEAPTIWDRVRALFA